MIENIVPCHLHDITSLNHNDNKLVNLELVFALCNNTAFDLCLICSNVGVVIFCKYEIVLCTLIELEGGFRFFFDLYKI